MALKDSHFKTAVELKGQSKLPELPMDIIAIGGGVLVVLVIVLFVVWKLMIKQDVPEG